MSAPPILFSVTLLLCLLACPSRCEGAPKTQIERESEYYKIVEIPIPDGVVLECGGFEWLPDGKLAVSTRHGDIYFVENPLAANTRRFGSPSGPPACMR